MGCPFLGSLKPEEMAAIAQEGALSWPVNDSRWRPYIDKWFATDEALNAEDLPHIDSGDFKEGPVEDPSFRLPDPHAGTRNAGMGITERERRIDPNPDHWSDPGAAGASRDDSKDTDVQSCRG